MTDNDPAEYILDIMKEEDLRRLANYFFVQNTPFNKLLGINIEWVEIDSMCLRIDMKDELVGNAFRGLVHGGVTASLLDVAGGIVAFFSLRNRLRGQSSEKISQSFSKFGTVDLRVDYLRPGTGKSFTATSSILRIGNKVAVTRMELHNDKGKLIAVGTGAYLVG